MSSHDLSHSDHHGEHADDGRVHAHISSEKMYVGILAALIVLTIITVGISYIHLGPLNLVVAIVVATIKATLVCMFFMHLKYDNKFNALVFVGTICFVGVFFAYTMNDTEHRAQVDGIMGARVDPATGEAAPGGYDAGPPEAEEGAAAEGHGEAGAAAEHH